MSGMAIERDSVPSPPLRFHPDFKTKQAGDIILRSDDDISFYFRLSHLAALSSFFSTLPPPSSDADFVDDTPLIPLRDATSAGLHMALSAITSTLSFAPFRLPLNIEDQEEADQAILSAAVIARKYDLAIVARLLSEAVVEEMRDGTSTLYVNNAYIEFAIWAIAGVRSKLPYAAQQTIEGSAPHITCISDTIAEMCRTHALRDWAALTEFHLHHSQAIHRFRKEFSELSEGFKPFHEAHLACSEEDGPREAVMLVRSKLLQAESMQEVEQLCGESYELGCNRCRAGANARYDDLVDKIREFANVYRLDD